MTSQSSKKTIVFDKPVGMTPLDCIKQFKSENPEYEDVKMGYAGRLDPMAEGLLLVLVGEENKKRSHYLDLDKEYEFNVLLGVATDTYDILGLITDKHVYSVEDIQKKKIENVLERFKGTIDQEFPPYSSKTVDGKPLYYWAREGKIAEIDVPSEKREIYDIKLENMSVVKISELREGIIKKLDRVEGNFRTEAVVKGWKEFFATTNVTEFVQLEIKTHCSSGTYMRSLAYHIGKNVGLPSLAAKIQRTKIGGVTSPTYTLNMQQQ